MELGILLNKMKKILLINSWMGPIPEYYKFHETTMQFQNNIYNIEVDNISNVKILKDALDGIQFTINLSIPNNIGSC